MSVLELAAQQANTGAEGKMVVRTVALSRLQSSRGWSGTPRMVRSSTWHRPASPVSHCLAPCGPGTTWRGQAWDCSPARLRQLLCVVTVAWDPHPREPIEGVLRATSVLELAAQQADSGAEGKTLVRTVALSRLQSSHGWSGMPRTVRLLSNGRARAGQRRRAVGEDLVASSVSPFLEYVTLGIRGRRARKSGPRRGQRVGFSGRYNGFSSPLEMSSETFSWLIANLEHDVPALGV
ncbi:hypothetical protein Taro_036093 [Colocasia esculenta]|uniref:Uncharacterized protein n=1 Tax=Colocasia esculenta TaxID=4460 RepID=A0A843W5R7_COLES|nr:hypothetical protein [Colocasia esculenta]